MKNTQPEILFNLGLCRIWDIFFLKLALKNAFLQENGILTKRKARSPCLCRPAKVTRINEVRGVAGDTHLHVGCPSPREQGPKDKDCNGAQGPGEHSQKSGFWALACFSFLGTKRLGANWKWCLPLENEGHQDSVHLTLRSTPSLPWKRLLWARGLHDKLLAGGWRNPELAGKFCFSGIPAVSVPNPMHPVLFLLLKSEVVQVLLQPHADQLLGPARLGYSGHRELPPAALFSKVQL